MTSVISVQNLSKSYRLGEIGSGTLIGDVNRWWSKLRGRPERLSDVGEPDHGNRQGGEIWALKDINLEVEAGEVLGIIGRNGAGKSTLLKILSSITAPTSGRAILRGRVGCLLEVGTGFHPELTGRENVFLNGAILGMSKCEVGRKLDEIVDFSGVDKYLDTPVKRYSSGMTVRLAFAVAAHLEPEILIVDEVLAVGDAAFQKKCIGKMSEVSTEGRTVLFVSHNMTSMKSLCKNGILLQQGSIFHGGEIAEVVENYLSSAANEVRGREWPNPASAPGDDSIRIKEVKVAPKNNNSNGVIRVNTPIDIVFSFWVLKGITVNLSMHVKHVSGELVFASASHKADLDPGEVEFKCVIPSELLNDNFYSVLLMVVMNSTPLFVVEDIVSIDIQDIPRAGGWLGKWPGVVRPKLAWTHEKLAS